jgi:transmembrane sensor
MDRETLYKFFEGAASYEEEVRIRQWMEHSPENRREFLKERKIFDSMLLLGDEKTIEEKMRHKSWSLSSLGTELIKIAAAVAVTLGLSLLYQFVSDKNGVVPMQSIYVPTGQRVNITLSDGTNVWLNACSEMTYPASFSEDIRRVSLKGEAYFDVSKDVEHPFVVQTKKCDIKVLGTEFNVRVNEAESDCEFSAALLEGSIELTNKMEPGPSIRLAPMQKAEWTGGKMVVESIRNLDDYRWKEGLICFEDIRFADLMKRFEKTYDIRIVIQNKSLHDYKCSGKCRVSDGVDFILQVLQRSTRFTFSRSDDNTIIYIK